jgi:hypothetical protein
MVKINSEDLRGMYSSLNVISVMKSRRMKLVGSVARVGEIINICLKPWSEGTIRLRGEGNSKRY